MSGYDPTITSDSARPTFGRLLYRLTFVCSMLTSLVVLAFFVIGVGDGSVSTFNLALWIGLLACTVLSLWGGHALRRKGHTVLAIGALAITAVPGVLMLLFTLFMLIAQPRWN